MSARTGAQAAIVAVTGLTVGALTSILQTYLGFPWLALVNAASPWLIAPFALGALRRSPASAAVAGLAACLLEVAGYYLTSAVRGYSGGLGYELLWTACALAGGPVFGTAGWLWRSGPRRWRMPGAAALPAAFAFEGLANYGARLHYFSSEILFMVIAALVMIGLGLTALRNSSAQRPGSGTPSGSPL